MSAIDIILISAGGLAVICYLISQIIKYKKDKKSYQNYLDQGYTPEQAKKAMQLDKQKGKKDKNKDVFDDE